MTICLAEPELPVEELKLEEFDLETLAVGPEAELAAALPIEIEPPRFALLERPRSLRFRTIAIVGFAAFAFMAGAWLRTIWEIPALPHPAEVQVSSDVNLTQTNRMEHRPQLPSNSSTSDACAVGE